MAQTLFEQLTTMTVAVCDTGDFNSIKKLTPRDATTNPSLITAAAQMPEYAEVVDGALRWAAGEAKGEDARVVGLAVDRLAAGFGLRIPAIVPGRGGCGGARRRGRRPGGVGAGGGRGAVVRPRGPRGEGPFPGGPLGGRGGEPR